MPCFPLFRSFFCSMLMLGLHAHMLDIMSMVMSCLDLHVCMHVLCSYAYIQVFTCLYTWIHVLPCLCARFLYVYMHVSMPICLYLCFHMLVCLDLCLYMLYAIFHVLVCSMPCLCASALAMFVMSCAIVALLSLCLSFLCFCLMVGTRSRPYGLCHCPYTLAHIKGFGSSLFACLCLLAFMLYACVSGFVVVWLHPTPMRPCLDVNIWEASPWCQLLCAYLSPFLLHAMQCLPCLFVPLVGFIFIFTRLLTCPYMSLSC